MSLVTAGIAAAPIPQEVPPQPRSKRSRARRPEGEVLSLLQRARAGDRAALGDLLRSYRAQMHSLALRICRRPADADDAVQEACLAVIEKLHQYRGDAPFYTWLYRVTSNAALLLLRRQRRTLVLLDAERRAVSAPSETAALPDDLCHHRRNLRAVALAARKLRPALLHTLELRELYGMDGAEVAEHLGVTAEVVKTRIHRARTALRQALPDSADDLGALPAAM